MYFLPGGGRNGARFAAGFRQWRNSWTASDAIRFAIAAILFTAAGLKTHQLATEPVLGDGLLESRWFLIAVVEFELLFGLWLAAGLFPVPTWLATLALFAVFSLVALYKAMSGEASCGCFGAVRVNPWFTLALDVLALGFLIRWRPQRQNSRLGGSIGGAPRVRIAGVIVAWLCVGVSSGAVMASYQTRRLGDVGQVLGDGRTVVLEPETWVGKRLPLLDWIEIDAQLDKGLWIVVLHRPGCPDCEELLRQLADHTDGSSRTEGSLAIVTVESEHSGLSYIPRVSRFVQGTLAESHEWFVKTPVQIETMEGIVQRTSVGRGEDVKRRLDRSSNRSCARVDAAGLQAREGVKRSRELPPGLLP